MAVYAPTDLIIANLALSHLKAGEIASLAETTVAAKEANRWYSHALTSTLEIIDWSFARGYAALVEETSITPKVGWAYTLQYPSDALKIRGIARDFAGEPARAFEVGVVAGNRVVYADKREGYLRYTRYVDNAAEFPGQFVVALSHRLASLIAKPISGSAELSKEQDTLFRQAVLEASANDLNEGVRDPISPHDRDPDWIEAR